MSIEHRNHASAKEAFEHLGEPVSLGLVYHNICNRIATAHGVDIRRWGRRKSKMFYLFHEIPLLTESLRVLRTQTQIIFFSDVYDVDDDCLERFVAKCAQVGLNPHVFVATYPDLEFKNGYNPPKTKVVNFGYSRLYRGKLCGAVFDITSGTR